MKTADVAMSWGELMDQVHAWGTRNFGVVDAWVPLLGMVEEYGEYQDARTRVDSDGMQDALGDQCIYALNFCKLVGCDWPPINAYSATPHSSLGKMAQALIKHRHGIRGFDDAKLRAQVSRCMVGWYGWIASEAHRQGFPDIYRITTRVWAQVSGRDWLAYPDTGLAPRPNIVADDLEVDTTRERNQLWAQEQMFREGKP